MQNKCVYILFIMAFFLCACGINTELQVQRELPPKDNDCKINVSKKKNSSLFYELIAEIYVGDTGFTVNCGYARMIREVREKACSVGGDAILILDIQQPDLSSTCYRVTAEIFKTDNKKVIKPSKILGQVLDTAYAQEKQKACLAPMGALGDISEMQKQIIFNSLQESLSTQYVLASQKAFEAAQTQAFDELEYDECTEDQCFALIQQILQVDNLFLFNMTREGNFTQLSLTRVDPDSQRVVRTANCEDCNIKQLNNYVDELVMKIFEEDQN